MNFFQQHSCYSSYHLKYIWEPLFSERILRTLKAQNKAKKNSSTFVWKKGLIPTIRDPTAVQPLSFASLCDTLCQIDPR